MQAGALFLVCPSDDVIDADVVEVGEHDQKIDRDRPRPFFISPVDLALALQMIRNFLLRQVVVDPKILQTLKKHRYHP